MNFYKKLLASFDFPLLPILCIKVAVTECVDGILWLDVVNKLGKYR
jgi:hypothetical protein